MKIQKFSTLKEKEQNTVIEHVEAMEASMKLEDNKRGPFSKEQFGMCHDCSFLLANITEYGNTIACCLKFKKYLSGKDSVKYCTIYCKKNQMALWEMNQIAYIIDNDEKTTGFIK